MHAPLHQIFMTDMIIYAQWYDAIHVGNYAVDGHGMEVNTHSRKIYGLLQDSFGNYTPFWQDKDCN